MSRSKRFISGLLSSYASIGVNILFTLGSVPLALHYLGKDEFGLWALVTQLSGYLMLLEFGMTGSVARSLSDHKDHVENGIYGSILRTGARVFTIQGVIVALVGATLAYFAPHFFGLPPNLEESFTILMASQAVITGIRLAFGTLASPLWCHQRLDLSNLSSSLSLVGTFAFLWIGFHLGWRTYSLIVSTIAGSLISLISQYLFCKRLGYYPPSQHKGSYDPKLFHELFKFGGGLFMLSLGAQLASTSQVIVVSRLLGLEAAATWSISTKVFAMAQQFVSRVLDSSAGALAEMVVRKESIQLQKRFQDLVSISAVMAVAASAGIALINGAFIECWTSGKVTWAPWNNCLLACVLFSTAVTRCHIGLVGITKQIRGMKFVCFIEGLAFVCLSVLVVPRLGLAGLLIAALICNIVITGIYGVSRTSEYFDVSTLTVAKWVTRPLFILLIITVIFAITQIFSFTRYNPLIQLFIGSMIFCVVVIPLLCAIGINQDLRDEFKGLIIKFGARTRSKIKPIQA